MITLIPTLIFAFIIVIIAVGLLAIGWLIRGKSILRPGACGRDPTKKQGDPDCDPNTSCHLCKNSVKKKK